mmetsp:Transcript_19566/g.63525  ORF Transcript_19566/g.63525 Transcript_19566/m.63525 type:complete len:210 (+) Transcript_19566:2214-2843(+)
MRERRLWLLESSSLHRLLLLTHSQDSNVGDLSDPRARLNFCTVRALWSSATAPAPMGSTPSGRATLSFVVATALSVPGVLVSGPRVSRASTSLCSCSPVAMHTAPRYPARYRSWDARKDAAREAAAVPSSNSARQPKQACSARRARRRATPSRSAAGASPTRSATVLPPSCLSRCCSSSSSPLSGSSKLSASLHDSRKWAEHRQRRAAL